MSSETSNNLEDSSNSSEARKKATSAEQLSTQTTFVDYVAPPHVKLAPPAKYKLWLIVLVLVYIATTLSDEAGFLDFLRLHGWLSPEAALFCLVCVIVFVMVYATLDLAVFTFTFKCGEKPRGLGPWLKAGRCNWPYRFSPNNVPVVCVAGAIQILEEGFGMFDNTRHFAPPAPKPRRGALQKKKSRTAPPLSTSTANTTEQDQRTAPRDRFADSENDDDDDYNEPFECDSPSCHTVLKIEHRINPKKRKEYEKWILKIRPAIRQARGLLDVKRTDFVKVEMAENDGVDESDGADEEKGRVGGNLPRVFTSTHSSVRSWFHLQSNATSSSMGGGGAGCLQIIYVTFANIDYLNEWMLSPRRKALMKQLRPMLMQPDKVQVQNDRILPDAFTDLVTRQGEAVPSLPPKKWKVWWLTALALFITLRWANSFLPYYFEFWGLDDAHPRVRGLVSTFIGTFLNSYVLTPLLLFLFSPWLHRQPDELDTREPWRTFDDGVKKLWVKALVTFVFYGGCAITWIVKSQTT